MKILLKSRFRINFKDVLNVDVDTVEFIF